jgi:hypothetical protein
LVPPAPLVAPPLPELVVAVVSPWVVVVSVPLLAPPVPVVGPPEVGPPEVGPPEVGPPEVGPPEVVPPEVGPPLLAALVLPVVGPPLVGPAFPLVGPPVVVSSPPVTPEVAVLVLSLWAVQATTATIDTSGSAEATLSRILCVMWVMIRLLLPKPRRSATGEVGGHALEALPTG